MGTVDTLRQKTAAYAVKEVVRLLGDEPEKHLKGLLDLAGLIAVTEDHKQVISTVRGYLDQTGEAQMPAPVRTLMRALKQMSPNCREKLLVNALVNGTLQGRVKRDAVARDQGFRPPTIMLMSPTMRCNLACSGCYASNYKKSDDLPYSVMDRVLTEGKELGIYDVILLGGEPLVRHDVLDLIEKHDDVAFMMFTNGTLLTPAVASRLEQLGNVAVSVSIDGLAQAHDHRRGEGVFDRAVEGLRNLRAAGVPYGFSTMVTRNNAEDVIAEEFIDFLLDEGCLWGWHFLYMPVGEGADPSLMPTPEQREMLRQRGAQYIRTQKDLFVVDFWNDAPYVGGCIAGARYYFHINAKGDVEPCIFAHFATHNIKHCSLAEALDSEFFRAIKAQQPYDENLLRPCMIIDNTQVLRDVVVSCGARPTHAEAERLITDFGPALDAYAAAYKPIADEAWASLCAAKEEREAVACVS